MVDNHQEKKNIGGEDYSQEAEAKVERSCAIPMERQGICLGNFLKTNQQTCSI